MILDPHRIDLFGVRKDGGADLVIIPEGPPDDSPETQTLLLDKVEAYLGYINSADFHTECPQATAENTHIVLRLTETPPPVLLRLFEQIAPWTAEHHAVFSVEVKQP